MFSQICLLLLLAQTPQLMGKSSRNRQRHNRAAEKVPPMECVADYCLPHDYNALELPSSDRQDVQINLEVLLIMIHIFDNTK